MLQCLNRPSHRRENRGPAGGSTRSGHGRRIKASGTASGETLKVRFPHFCRDTFSNHVPPGNLDYEYDTKSQMTEQRDDDYSIIDLPPAAESPGDSVNTYRVAPRDEQFQRAAINGDGMPYTSGPPLDSGTSSYLGDELSELELSCDDRPPVTESASGERPQGVSSFAIPV